jgi:hypothetical protein
VQLVTDRLGEVDDGVAAEDQVVGPGAQLHLQQVAGVEAVIRAQVELRAPAASTRSNPMFISFGGAVRASSC